MATTPPASSTQNPPPTGVYALLLRMKAGDREAAATFMRGYGARLRRRIRGKLDPSMRRLFDSLEVMSTLGRRLDLCVLAGQLEATTEGQLWSLLLEMANHAVIDKARLFRRCRDVEDRDSAFAQALASRLRALERTRRDGVPLLLEQALARFDDPADRLILSNWLAGTALADIAPIVDLDPAAVRKRWERIRRTLRAHLEKELEP